MLEDEIADAIICLDLIAKFYGIEIDYAVAKKFNKTSKANELESRFEYEIGEGYGR